MHDAAARIPKDLSGRTLAGALLLALVLLGSAEAFWRGRGMLPTVPDTGALWALERKRALAEDERPLVILGSSRAILGLDLDTIEDAAIDVQPYQLGVYGSSPRVILAHLADETEFSGLVIAELNPIVFLDSSGSADQVPGQYLREVASGPLYRDLEVILRSQVHDHLALRRPALNPLNLLQTFRREGGLPAAEHIRVLPDRQALADFSKGDVQAMIDFRLPHFRATYHPYPVAERKALLGELVRNARKIAERGGRVLFLKMPTDGATRRLEDELAPDTFYWDQLEQALPGDLIRCDQESALGSFRTGDESHLDQVESLPFTKALMSLIAERKLLPRSWKP